MNKYFFLDFKILQTRAHKFSKPIGSTYFTIEAFKYKRNQIANQAEFLTKINGFHRLIFNGFWGHFLAVKT